MRLSWLATCLWPGLSRLWIAGHWPSLLWAFAFSVALNFLLAATFIWPEWLETILLAAGWLTIAGFWAFSAYSSLRWLRCDAACQFGSDSFERVGARPVESANEGGQGEPGEREAGKPAESFSSAAVFSAAQTDYLRGHWFEAEAKIKELLTHNPRDVEARLLWVGVLRRMKRVDIALRQLKILSRLEGADRWALEIRDERRRVAVLAKEVSQLKTAGPVSDEPATEKSSEQSTVEMGEASGPHPSLAPESTNQNPSNHDPNNRTDVTNPEIPPDQAPRTVPFARGSSALPAQSPPSDAEDDASLSEAA